MQPCLPPGCACLRCALCAVPSPCTPSRSLVPPAVQIDGKPVLKLNQYDLEGGKRSVFEQELNREWVRQGGGHACS